MLHYYHQNAVWRCGPMEHVLILQTTDEIPVTDLIPVQAIRVQAVRVQDCQPASRAQDRYRQFEFVLVEKIQAQHVCFSSNKRCMVRATAQPP